MRNEQLFTRQASVYSQFRPSYPRALFNYLASVVVEQHTAWDCATGNGQSALSLAQLFKRVIATDANINQIKEASHHPNVFYGLSRAEAVPLASHSINLVTVSQAIHWFNLPEFYQEVRRVLKPRGLIAAWCYEGVEINPAVDKPFKRLLNSVTGPYWAPQRQLINAHYQTLPFPFEELTPPSFAINVEMTLDQLKGYAESWSATQKFIEIKEYNPWDEIRVEITRAWGDPAKKYPARWPLYMRVGRVKA